MKILSITNFLDQAKGKCIIDVRSEGEFLKGNIIHSINVALFNNNERAKIGTTYKQIGKEQALLEGLEIVGPKMASMVNSVKEISDEKDIFIYCWRGGMRSNSVGWLLELIGYRVFILQGGYKSYRREVNSFFNTVELQFNVLSGFTGSGKTAILQKLKECGEQIIDLEQLAHHKGSAFGALGQRDNPSQEDFDNTLFAMFQNMDIKRPIWIEDESKNIGRIYLPLKIYSLIQTSPIYCIHVAKSQRIERLIAEYAMHSKTALEGCLYKIKKRLGGQAFKDCLQALEENNFTYFTELVLFYYDRTYLKHLNEKNDRIVKKIDIINNDYDLVINQLLAPI